MFNRRILSSVLLSITVLLGDQPQGCQAQFGLGAKKKGDATSFESMQEMAKEQFDGSADMMGLADLLGGDIDMSELEALMEEAMKDPETMQQMMDLQKEMMSAMNELGNMSPEELMETASSAVSAMMDDDVLDMMFQDTDALIEQLAASGMVDAAQIAQYKENPDLLKKDMKEGISQMQDAFSDKDTMDAAIEAMKSFGALMSDPKALDEAMKGVTEMMESLSSDMSSDEKIEEARLQILSDPTFGGNDALANIYSTDEMKEVLKDSKKWRDAVKMGKGMMFNKDEL